MISREEINKKIKAAFRDYNIDPGEIYLIESSEKYILSLRLPLERDKLREKS
jgi:hypothetical protein